MTTLLSNVQISQRVAAAFPEERAAIATMVAERDRLTAGRGAFIAAHPLDACRDYDSAIADRNLAIEHAEIGLRKAEDAMRAEEQAKVDEEKARLFMSARVMQMQFSSTFIGEYEAACHKIVAMIEAGQSFARMASQANNDWRPEGSGDISTGQDTLSYVRGRLELPSYEGHMIWRNGALRTPFEDGYDPVGAFIKQIIDQTATIIKTVPPADLHKFASSLSGGTPASVAILDPDADADESDDAQKPGLARRVADYFKNTAAPTTA